MKLSTFLRENATRVGLVVDDGVVDFSTAAPNLPPEISALLAADALHEAPNAAKARPSFEAAVARWAPAPILGLFRSQGESVWAGVDPLTRRG